MAERKNEQVPLRAVLRLICPELQSGGIKASSRVGGLTQGERQAAHPLRSVGCPQARLQTPGGQLLMWGPR